MPKSDVTAVILTIGEATTQRAIESVKAQSLQPCEMIVIDHVSPFHRAMNQAIQQVRSTFFIQVDADMVLDQHCVAQLRQCMNPQVGLVVGHLRDPLIQKVVGIKMYRTASLRDITFQDSLSPDTDVGKQLMTQGWDILYALDYSQPKSQWWHCFGEHYPDYTPHYTFRKCMLEGSRYRYRGKVSAFKGHLARLPKGKAEVAMIAQVAFAHGLFSEESGDGLKPFVPNDEWRQFETFMQSSPNARLSLLSIASSFVRGKLHSFEGFYWLGVAIKHANALGTFLKIMKMLNYFPIQDTCIPIVALSHGVVSLQEGELYPRHAKKMFHEFFACEESKGINKTLVGRTRSRAFWYWTTITRLLKEHSR